MLGPFARRAGQQIMTPLTERSRRALTRGRKHPGGSGHEGRMPHHPANDRDDRSCGATEGHPAARGSRPGRSAQEFPIERSTEEDIMTDSLVVNGHTLAPLGMVAGRTIYRFTSHGEAYRLTPDLPTTYLLRRPADGYSGVFATVEEAVAYADALER
jgi:hypothetical protein